MQAAPLRSYPPIPYGMADFAAMRREGYLYVDKSRFVRDLENERYVFFVRPRRFGKSCLLSLLESYYDRSRKNDFEAVFNGLDIGKRPTPLRSRYVVLRFNFSAFDDRLETLEQSFRDYCLIKLRGTLERNADLFPDEARARILSFAALDSQLNALFEFATDNGVPLYVLIDEYDNFANTILAHEGQQAYHAFTHGGGFFRNFFATLKAGAEGGNLERLFVTGVSPVTMDDVTSGFNIGSNISLDAEFNAMAGFTEAEVRGLVEMYRDMGVFDRDVDEALAAMREWYNGYRFSEQAEEVVYNTDMVLYYLKNCIPNKRGPRELIDHNVRVDYDKLRHLLVVNREASAAAATVSGASRQAASNRAGLPAAADETAAMQPMKVGLNGNFDLLRQVVAEGHVDSDLRTSFPVKQLAQRENFLTLLHCFGLLSIREVVGGRPRLAVPNQTVRHLLYGYLRDGYRDVGAFSVDLLAFERLTWAMAADGAWRPAIDFLADALQQQTNVRAYIRGESLLQGFLAAYLGASGYFVFHTEKELEKGYADMVLEPLTARYPSIRHGYVIELKYLTRSPARAARADAALASAKEQLRTYLADARLAREHPTVRFTGLVLVFRGWELERCEAVPAAL